jgi:hypothetical protein
MTELAITTIEHETDVGVRVEQLVMTSVFVGGSESQPLDSNLTAIAALSTTAYGRAFLVLVDAAAGRTALSLGTASTHAVTDFDAFGAAGAAQAAAIAASDTTGSAAAVLVTAKAYADGLVLGLLDDRGNFNASGNTFPASGGSGSAGAILKGDLWTISIAGTLGGMAVTAGDVVRALSNTPGQTAGNWAITEHDFGYVAENSANKATSISGSNTDVQYPSAKLLYDQLQLKEAAGLAATETARAQAAEAALQAALNDLFFIGLLYVKGAPGAWFDPLDLTSAFQDSAGTTPVTAVEQPIGKRLDKSGRGNHASQATTTARPTLSARKNLATSTEVIGAGTPWNCAPNYTITPDVSAPPLGLTHSALLTPLASAGPTIYSLGAAPSTAVAVSGYFKAGSATSIILLLRNQTTATNFTYMVLNLTNGSGATTGWTIEDVGGGWYRAKFIQTTGITVGDQLTFYYGVSSTVAAGLSWNVTGIQFEPIAVTLYQCVSTASNYDTNFPTYDGYDGASNSLATTVGGGASTSAFICVGFRSNAAGVAQTLWSDRTGNTGLKLEVTAANAIAFSGGNGSAIITATGGAIVAYTDYVVTAIYDGANLSVQLNSLPATTAACVLSAGTAAISLAKDNGAASGFLKGRVYECVYVKNTPQSARRIASTKQYVAALSGVTL